MICFHAILQHFLNLSESCTSILAFEGDATEIQKLILFIFFYYFRRVFHSFAASEKLVKENCQVLHGKGFHTELKHN